MQVPCRGLLRAAGLEGTGLHAGGLVPVHGAALTGDAMPRELSAEFQGKAGTCPFRPVLVLVLYCRYYTMLRLMEHMPVETGGKRTMIENNAIGAAGRQTVITHLQRPHQQRCEWRFAPLPRSSASLHSLVPMSHRAWGRCSGMEGDQHERCGALAQTGYNVGRGCDTERQHASTGGKPGTASSIQRSIVGIWR